MCFAATTRRFAASAQRAVGSQLPEVARNLALGRELDVWVLPDFIQEGVEPGHLDLLLSPRSFTASRPRGKRRGAPPSLCPRASRARGLRASPQFYKQITTASAKKEARARLARTHTVRVARTRARSWP